MNTRTHPAVTGKRAKSARIHASALGGFTMDGPYFRHRSHVANALDRFFYWLGA